MCFCGNLNSYLQLLKAVIDSHNRNNKYKIARTRVIQLMKLNIFLLVTSNRYLACFTGVCVISESCYHDWYKLSSGNCKLLRNQQWLTYVITKEYFSWEEQGIDSKKRRIWLRIYLQWFHISRSFQYLVSISTGSPNLNLTIASKIHS